MEFVLLLVVLLAFGLRTSWFQTWAAQQVASYLSSELGTEVSIEKVEIIFFDSAELRGVYVEDCRKDTLLFTESIMVEIDDWSISEEFIAIHKADLADGKIYIRKYEGDSTLNFQHIINYFAADEPDTSTSKFGVTVRTVWLEHIDFIYEDQNAEKLKHGMDYAHIGLKHFDGHFSDFELNGDSISVTIDKLRFKERSGLILDKFSTELLFCPESVSLKDLKIGFNNSYLFAEIFELNTPNGSEDWQDFVHRVRFNAKIRNSKISLRDVAYFVPKMWGMTDRINIHNMDITGPVYGMKLKELHITMLEETVLKGRFEIPNLDQIDEAFFLERIKLFETSIADVESLNLSPFLPDGEKYIKIPANFAAANKIRIVEGHMNGFLRAFTVDGDIYSGLGDIHSSNGLSFFLKDSAYCRDAGIPFDGNDSTYWYTGAGGVVNHDVIVENLNLAAISGNPLLGTTTGYARILPGSRGLNMKEMNLEFLGNFSTLTLNNYNYHDINIYEGNFSHNRFSGKIDIADDNLALNYKGFIDLNGDLTFDFDVRIDSAHLSELANRHDSVFHRFEGDIHVKMKGNSINSLRGVLIAENLRYQDGRRFLNMDKLSVDLIRTPSKKGNITNDTVYIRSDFVDLDLFGVFDFQDMHQVILNELAYVANNLIGEPKTHDTKNEFFDLEIRLKDINPIMPFFNTEARIAKNTLIQSKYDKKKKLFGFDVSTDSVSLGQMKLFDFKMENHFDSTKATAFYQADYAQLNDSAKVRNLYLDSEIKKNRASNSIGWDNLGAIKPALFAFASTINEDQSVHTKFFPSFFFLQNHRYKISTSSEVTWSPDQIVMDDFKISEGEHFLSLDGIISKNPNDSLNFKVHDFDLADLNGLLEADGMTIEGLLNIDGKVADVYKNIRFNSESDITDFYINDRLVGDINVGNKWQHGTQSVFMNGALKRNGIETFGFRGNYFLDREKDNVKVDLIFAETDISFFNAFENPELYTNIEGFLNGKLKVTGELTNPVVKGYLAVHNVLVFVPMFNVGYGIDGKLQFDKGEIYADYMDVYDQEGNKAQAGLSIYHYDWADWNYDISLDMTETKKHFFVLDTKYKEGEFYYGRAFIDGCVNISGYGGKTIIEVDAETKEGTELTLPMYGASELEESSFIIWKGGPGDEEVVETTVEKSGLELKMKFRITPEARTTVVFDPITEDQISVHGGGDLEINVDEYSEVTMFGKYVISSGNYQMHLTKFVNKKFDIKPGSYLIWTHSPYDALIDITAQFKANVNFKDIAQEARPDRQEDEVIGSLIMKEKLLSPKLSFDIEAPNADELAKSALVQLRSNRDLMNKQFFSVLILGKFFTTITEGAGAAGMQAARDAAESQINAILNSVGGNYDLSVDLKEGQTNFGASTQLGEKITITTSFGVVSNDPDDPNSQDGGSIVGDVSVDYRLNDDGSFTLNFFNESNTGTEAELGPYTQGVGLHYTETFNSAGEFRLLQRFLNLFRKKENKVDLKREKNKVRLPPIEPKQVKDADEKSTDSK